MTTMPILGLAELLTTGGIAVVVTILVQLLKGGVVAERAIPWLAVALGMAIAVAAAAALGQRAAADLGNAALTGFLGGAAAIGLYQLQRPIGLLGPRA